MASPTLVEVPAHQRLESVGAEIHSKGNCYLVEDVLRHQILIVAQRMAAVQHAIEECVGEPCSIASLFESANLQLRKGRTGSFRVHKLSPAELPAHVDETRSRYGRTVIAAVNPAKWTLVDA